MANEYAAALDGYNKFYRVVTTAVATVQNRIDIDIIILQDQVIDQVDYSAGDNITYLDTHDAGATNYLMVPNNLSAVFVAGKKIIRPRVNPSITNPHNATSYRLLVAWDAIV